MDASISVYLLSIFILLGLSAFFSGSETAIFSLPARRLKEMLADKEVGASELARMKKDPRRILTTILLGNDLVNITISVLTTGLLAGLLSGMNPTLFFIITTGLTAFVVILFGEILPKNIAIRMAPLLAPLVVYPLKLFSIITFPVRFIILFISDKMMAFFGGKIGEGRRMIVEEEFRTLVAASRETDEINHLEKNLVDNVFNFSVKRVCDFLTPWEKVVSLPVEAGFQEVLNLLKKRRFSRIPVYREKKNQIVGVLHSKELLTCEAASGVNDFSLEKLMAEPTFVSPDQSASSLLKIFQNQKNHIAFVKDGDNLLGLVTLDDLLRNLLRA